MASLIIYRTDNKKFVGINSRNGWSNNDTPTRASFRAWYDDKYLHVLFKTVDAPLRVTNFEPQSPVSQDSCCEIFIRPSINAPYWNYEFNAAGAVNASHRMTRNEKTPLTEEEINSIVRHTDPRFDTAEPVDIAGNDNSWQLQVDIPWALMGITPDVGVFFGVNVYATASKATPPYWLSWTPVDTPAPDFHRPEFFGEFTLG